MIMNINMKLITTAEPYISEYDEYFCVIRKEDGKIAMDNTNSPGSQTLMLLNYPIIFKTRLDATRYLMSRVDDDDFDFYAIRPVCEVCQNKYRTVIVGYFVDK